MAVAGDVQAGGLLAGGVGADDVLAVGDPVALRVLHAEQLTGLLVEAVLGALLRGHKEGAPDGGVGGDAEVAGVGGAGQRCVERPVGGHDPGDGAEEVVGPVAEDVFHAPGFLVLAREGELLAELELQQVAQVLAVRGESEGGEAGQAQDAAGVGALVVGDGRDREAELLAAGQLDLDAGVRTQTLAELDELIRERGGVGVHHLEPAGGDVQLPAVAEVQRLGGVEGVVGAGGGQRDAAHGDVQVREGEGEVAELHLVVDLDRQGQDRGDLGAGGVLGQQLQRVLAVGEAQRVEVEELLGVVAAAGVGDRIL